MERFASASSTTVILGGVRQRILSTIYNMMDSHRAGAMYGVMVVSLVGTTKPMCILTMKIVGGLTAETVFLVWT
jgi:hypothetical protein